MQGGAHGEGDGMKCGGWDRPMVHGWRTGMAQVERWVRRVMGIGARRKYIARF